MESRYNTRSPAVKRLMREAQELSQPTDQYFAQPLEDNLFEWHFTVRGPSDSDFQNGIYHGRIILPVDYPMKPPSIIWLTPNGRFETNKKICLSISGHHPESWQPSWSIRTALLAIIGFMPTHPNGAIGSLDYTPDERKILSKKSKDWKCPVCGDISKVLLEPDSESIVTEKEAKELATHIDFQVEKPKSTDGERSGNIAAACATDPQTSAANTQTGAFGLSSQPPMYTTAASPLPCSQMFPSWGSAPRVMPNNMPDPEAIGNRNPWLSSQFQPGPADYSRPYSGTSFPYPPSRYLHCGYSNPFFRSGCALPPGVGMFPCPSYPRSSSGLPSGSRPYCGSSMQPKMNTASVAINTSATGLPPTTEDAAINTTNVEKNADASTNPPPKEDLDKLENKNDDKVPELNDKIKSEKDSDASGASSLNKNTSSLAADSSTSEDYIDQPKDDLAHKDTFTRDETTVGAEEQRLLPDAELNAPLPLKQEKCHNGVEGKESTYSESHNVEEDNSDTGIPQIELSDTEQRSFFEKSTSCSVPNLEKNRQESAKGLRLRQSAPGQAIADGSEVSQSSASSEQAGGARKIEAASGDNPQRTNPQGIRIVQLGRGQQRDRAQQSYLPTDSTFLLMVVLSLVTVFILLKRILHMVDWSELGASL